MSKHEILTEQEMATYQPGAVTLWYLADYARRHGLAREEITVLDWGCGRGRSVAYLRKYGYNAFGVEVDAEVVTKGQLFFAERGLDAEQVLTLLDKQGRSPFADNFFHITFSEAVFEHIQDLALVAAELSRITCSGGIGIHSFPARYHLVEAHLHMPFVHWLPKNHWRRQLIGSFVRLGLEPGWSELQAGTVYEKIEGYYRYSIDKTYYRRPAEIKQLMQQHGFTPQFVSVDHPKLKKYPAIRYLTQQKIARHTLNWVFVNFFLVNLLLTRQ